MDAPDTALEDPFSLTARGIPGFQLRSSAAGIVLLSNIWGLF